MTKFLYSEDFSLKVMTIFCLRPFVNPGPGGLVKCSPLFPTFCLIQEAVGKILVPVVVPPLSLVFEKSLENHSFFPIIALCNYFDKVHDLKQNKELLLLLLFTQYLQNVLSEGCGLGFAPSGDTQLIHSPCFLYHRVNSLLFVAFAPLIVHLGL